MPYSSLVRLYCLIQFIHPLHCFANIAIGIGKQLHENIQQLFKPALPFCLGSYLEKLYPFIYV